MPAIVVDLIHVAFASSLMILVILLSRFLELGLEFDIFIAAIRTFLQLYLVSYILTPIFASNEPLWVFIFVIVVILLASWECSDRTKYTFKNQLPWVLFAMFIGNVIVGVLCIFFILQIHPPWDPGYVIPIIGMLLGNNVKGQSLGLDYALSHIIEEQSVIEAYLTAGATPWEATQHIRRGAFRIGLLPTIASMNIIGLISIPGMMTGQILAGSSPVLAARYQMIIMYLIAFGSMISMTISILALITRVIFDERERLQADRIRKRIRMGKRKDWVSLLLSKAYNFLCCMEGAMVEDPQISTSERTPLLNESKSRLKSS